MKMVYILLVHTNADQIVRLITRLNTPQTRFVIHVSQNCEPGLFETLTAAAQQFPNIDFSKRCKVKWGNADLLQALLNCIKLIVSEAYQYDRVYILSGQDYPLQSNTEISETLAHFEGKQIMEYFPLPDEARGVGEGRAPQ